MKNRNNHTEIFYQFLRLSLGQTQEFPVDVDERTWLWLFKTAVRQSLVGICYQGVCLLPNEKKPPLKMFLKWVCAAEAISGHNEFQYQEAVRLTRLCAEKGRKTAILKGQANARLYPNKSSRQPGDIDIWVEGGLESVLALFPNHRKVSYHHVELPKSEKGVEVEVHFRPSSGNYNPFTNRRLQQWLEREIQNITAVPEGFNVPSVRFALVMQLAHIQRHFIRVGVGLRHVCDYYWLLRHSTEEDRREVSSHLKRFGLQHIGGALMWVLGEVLKLDPTLMLCEPDSYRGEWMLREIMAGGNLGRFSQRRKHGILRYTLESMRRCLRLMRFDFWEAFWTEVDFCKKVVKSLPTLIKRKRH